MYIDIEITEMKGKFLCFNCQREIHLDLMLSIEDIHCTFCGVIFTIKGLAKTTHENVLFGEIDNIGKIDAP